VPFSLSLRESSRGAYNFASADRWRGWVTTRGFSRNLIDAYRSVDRPLAITFVALPTGALSLSLLPSHAPALLALADGTVFKGRSVGAAAARAGEVVFNTALTGYQEILTDPSYRGQHVTLTYPHIGNVGCNPQDEESAGVHASGLIVRDVPAVHSNFRAQESLTAYLQRHGVPGIADIDTRQLTRHLRTHGAQNGCILALAAGDQLGDGHVRQALALAREAPSMAGLDLASVVTTREPYAWTEGEWRLQGADGVAGFNPTPARRFKVVAFDFGVKRNILRMLAERGCEVQVVPARTSAAAALAYRPDGIFLSNGPGDPEPCTDAIAASRELIDRGLPTFGICLGHQIMAIASGAKTFKMKFGHHGANHPVRDHDSGRVSITSQNHGFAVDPATLGPNLRVTHTSLFDGTVQGLARTDRPAFCFQGHPEASPGPHDIAYLFDRFIGLMTQHAAEHATTARSTTHA
jgi:carbamoyl-phosphate synthase small subunit